ncbi:hypothetical protein, partial [Phascolarctobacterium faecium]|uniref:hypothetical protein n=1 Tax=Phascolarctobacterium faecium TaxID=33025 RepID=UPI00247A0F02
ISMRFCSFIFLLCHSFFLRISFVFYKIGFDAILPYSLSACKLLLGFMTIIKKNPITEVLFFIGGGARI